MPPRPPEETLNSASYRGARKQGAVMSASHDDSYAKPVTAMTLAEINKKNEALHHNVGVAPSQEAAPELAGTRVSKSVPVWTGAGIGDEGAEQKKVTHAEVKRRLTGIEEPKQRVTFAELTKSKQEHKKSEDEVRPTQSDPPDGRSDNLLGEAAVAGERDEETPKKPKWSPTEVIRQQQAAIKQNPNEAKRIKEGKWRGEFAEDDLAEGTESMPPEGQADAENTMHGPADPHYAVSSKATKGTMLGGVKSGTSSSFVKREHAERLAEVNKEINSGAGRETEHKVVAVKPSKRSITPKELGE